MGTRELLTYLEKLEIGLSSFSYDELGTEDAGKLKKSFDNFKNGLENKVFGVSEMKQLDVIYEQIGISSLPEHKVTVPIEKEINPAHEVELLFTLVHMLDQTQLDRKQQEMIKALKKVSQRLNTVSRQMNSKQKPVATDAELIEKNLESVFTTQKVNLRPVLDECMGQMELLEELVRIYKQNILEFIGKVKVNLQTENFRGVDFACQKIEACLKMMKTVSLLEITEQMSMVCKTDNDIKYLNFLYQQFLVEYPKVEELVDFEIDVLRNM
ncbi:hypothetical protein [Flagellimonas flava]|uniref:Uncharacterized protein n=1 Tax=Flagellimonas flava TaxID=570519 RepID=A0A1M5IUK4_9FLAO|nr:hypothetical protein [Allomuricauda flava]SHG31994.1 hypothetical protein SAMN04488116_0937 [Allomuricauda flava]